MTKNEGGHIKDIIIFFPWHFIDDAPSHTKISLVKGYALYLNLSALHNFQLEIPFNTHHMETLTVSNVRVLLLPY